jgi:hypothetical protein
MQTDKKQTLASRRRWARAKWKKARSVSPKTRCFGALLTTAGSRVRVGSNLGMQKVQRQHLRTTKRPEEERERAREKTRTEETLLRAVCERQRCERQATRECAGSERKRGGAGVQEAKARAWRGRTVRRGGIEVRGHGGIFAQSRMSQPPASGVRTVSDRRVRSGNVTRSPCSPLKIQILIFMSCPETSGLVCLCAIPSPRRISARGSRRSDPI